MNWGGVLLDLDWSHDPILSAERLVETFSLHDFKLKFQVDSDSQCLFFVSLDVNP